MNRQILIILIIHTVLQSNSLPLLSQELQFYREDIVFVMNSESMTTDAVYYFVNIGEKNINTMLFYPFPENTISLIDSISISDDKSGKTIDYLDGKSGVYFNISVSAYGQCARRVYFRQALHENHFRYILTSTASWKRALEFANFELQVPVEIKVDSLSITPDTSFIKNDLQYLFWKKKDFMPDRDFEVWF
jgi:hypothetical protein